MSVGKACGVALVLLVAACSAVPVSVNIHLKLNAAAEQTAIAYDSWCHDRLPSDDVWLSTLNQPHVTLYLTEFDSANLLTLEQRINEVVTDTPFTQCAIPLNATAATGDYGMWSVVNNACLQRLSDLLVNATCSLIVPNQPVPAWVYKLPEPLRSEKIKMIQLYGSPNVFSQFQPHVTLAYDNATADNFAAVFDSLPSQPLQAVGVVLGMGQVGNWGTVLRGKDWADWDLPTSLSSLSQPHAVGGAKPRWRGPRHQHAKGRRIPARGVGATNADEVLREVQRKVKRI